MNPTLPRNSFRTPQVVPVVRAPRTHATQRRTPSAVQQDINLFRYAWQEQETKGRILITVGLTVAFIIAVGMIVFAANPNYIIQ